MRRHFPIPEASDWLVTGKVNRRAEDGVGGDSGRRKWSRLPTHEQYVSELIVRMSSPRFEENFSKI